MSRRRRGIESPRTASSVTRNPPVVAGSVGADPLGNGVAFPAAIFWRENQILGPTFQTPPDRPSARGPGLHSSSLNVPNPRSKLSRRR